MARARRCAVPTRVDRARRRACALERQPAYADCHRFFRAPADEQSSDGRPDDANTDWGELVARLARFYGGDPLTWLMHTPVALVRSMALMLPRLEAEESLLTLTRLAIGVGSMGQRRALSTIDAWTA